MAQKQYAGSSVYNRYLGTNGFRGVDFSSHPSMVSEDRFSDMKNMWRDYHAGQGSAVETFPGYRLQYKFGGEIFGIYRYNSLNEDFLLVHAGTALYHRELITQSENSFTPISGITLSANKSSGFQYGDAFYIIDGEHYFKIIRTVSGGEEAWTGSSAEDSAYIPKTWLNGEEYEQRNMLTNKFKEEWFITEDMNYSEGTPGLNYVVTDSEQMTCACRGFKYGKSSSFVYVHPTAVIDGKTYQVKSVGGFSGGSVEDFIAGNGIEEIETDAFKDCQQLSYVYLSNTVVTVKTGAFSGCTALQDLYIHEDTETVEGGAFAGSGNTQQDGSDDRFVEYVFYSGTQASFSSKLLDGFSPTGNGAVFDIDSYNNHYYSNPMERLEYVTINISEFCKLNPTPTLYLDGIDLSMEGWIVTEMIVEDVYVKKVILRIYERTRNYIVGRTFRIEGELDQTKTRAKEDIRNRIPFYGSTPGYTGTMLEAIKGCTKTAQFDGRVFFSCNPDLPNTVFYSHRNLTGHNDPSYIGVYNYFDVGIGASPNMAMISTGSHLIVLKDNTVQDGAINLYEGVSSDDDLVPRYYVRSQGLPGIGCLGASCNFSDDPVFVTTRGLDAVGTQTVNLERTVQHRSSNIDRKLLNEDLENAVLTEWDGYLVLLCGSHAYLADSRQVFTHKTGVYQYEWYYLDDIGSYSGDHYAYYRREDENGYEKKYAYENVESVTSQEDDEEVTHYYVIGSGEEVYPFTEKSGGTFSPAVIAVGIDDFLFFGTGDGSLLIVNTDKRGTPPTGKIGAEIVVGSGADANYTAEEYSDLFGDIIPREWYSHCDHAYASYVTLASENAGIPHLTKSTVRKSCVVHFKNVFGADPKYNVKTDREEWERGGFEIGANMPDFADTNFDVTSFKTSQGYIVNLAEHKRKWVEKQFQFFSEECYRPFGLYDIAYQYIIEGRVKNR